MEYTEWKGSAHSRAYVSESFRKVTSQYKVKECLTCHVTNPIYDAKELTIRDHNREEGVSCVVCHLTPEQQIAGPLTVLPAHSVKMNDPYYKSSKLCGTCHEEHFQEWEKFSNSKKKTGKGQIEKTCQDCHMPEVKRKLITKGIFQYAHWEQQGKKHTFAIEVEPDKDVPWFRAEAKFENQEKGKFEVDLQFSHALPHSFPSGIFGFKAIDLIVSVKNAEGRTMEEQIMTIYAENKKGIKPGKQVDHRFTFSNSVKEMGEFLVVQVRRRKHRTDPGRILLHKQYRI